ncbi:Zona pellucida domain [Trinorchestia longiramus]|nr:Zona pellucida domain [Trinorchestia longiramus]
MISVDFGVFYAAKGEGERGETGALTRSGWVRCELPSQETATPRTDRSFSRITALYKSTPISTIMKLHHLTTSACLMLVFVAAGFGARLSALTSSGMPALQTLNAKCGRKGMTVQVAFDQPFPGIIYSKGFYSDRSCNYVNKENSGAREFTFLIPVDGCGTEGDIDHGKSQTRRDMFYENTIIIQTDPLITEVWDEARLLRCTWPHTVLKRVMAAPFFVAQPDKVSVEFDKRSINTLMEIQKGPGPLAVPASGYLSAGADTSVVIYIQDPGRSMDANVVNCSTSSDGSEVKLLDDLGCSLRPELMTHFDKTRKTNGVKADLMMYSYLKNFNPTEASDFVIRCEVELCKGQCSQPCWSDKSRQRRSLSHQLSADDAEDSKFSHHPARGFIQVQEIVNSRDQTGVEEAELVIEKEQLREMKTSGCNLSWSVFLSLLGLLIIIATLAILSCYLAVKLVGSKKWERV